MPKLTAWSFQAAALREEHTPMKGTAVPLGRECGKAMVKSEGQSTRERTRPQRVCSRPTFPSLQLNTNQHRHGRKLPRGGKVPPEKNRWHNQESHGAQNKTDKVERSQDRQREEYSEGYHLSSRPN